MKITIEIDDKALRDAVDAQVGATVALWTGKALEEKAAEVIGTKLSRFSIEEFVGRRMDSEVRRVVDDAINRTLGSHAETRSINIRSIVKETIAARVDSALKTVGAQS